MPSPSLERAAAAALAACLALVLSTAAVAEPLRGPIAVRASPEHVPGPRVTPQAVREAVKNLAHDPNVLHGEQSWVLTWAHHHKRVERRQEWPLFAALMGSMGVALRVVLWVLAAVAAGLLAVYLTRLAQLRAARVRLPSLRRPAQVQDLDIRPESLPADVGAAALALWERGELRAALALLYRGMLSRLVHVHAAPIRASSTEEECAQAAAARLEGAALDYVRGLIRAWQHAVYGGATPSPERFQRLCAELDTTLGAAAPGVMAAAPGPLR